jgi:hypothetical protein
MSAHVAQQENAPAGCSKRPSSKAATSEGPEAYPLGYVEGLNDARTKLADFFSILLEDGTLIKQERKDRMVSSWSKCQMGIAGIVLVIVCTLGVADLVLAGDDKTKEPAGVVDQVGTALKNTATKIEKEVSSVVKKLEESETPKKVGNELKRSAESLGQKIEEAGEKLKESFKSGK